MTTFKIDGVTVTFHNDEDLNPPISEEEALAYILRAEEQGIPRKIINRLEITYDHTEDGTFADLDYYFHPRPFNRIRRITGYLVGSLDNYNNAKRAEEHDRVKHSI